MTRSAAAGFHDRQVRYLIDRRGECRVVADASQVIAPVSVVVVAFMGHRECAQLLRTLAREIEGQP